MRSIKPAARTAGFFLLAWLPSLTLTAGTATINPQASYQTIEGLGGAIAFYAGSVSSHPYKLEIYSNAFAGLNLSMLRLGDWYRYQTNGNFDAPASDIVANASRILGHSVPILMSSWSPPAFLKSNGQVGNGGSLIFTNGGFDYGDFAKYWYDSLRAYESNGVSPTWISIQNEPDFIAGYDSCVFHPTEDTVNGTNYASYSKALDAVFQQLTNLPSPPKLLAPEVVGLGFNDVQNYAATMKSNSFYGLAHHLYGGSTDGSPNGYVPALQALTNVFPGKPKFMTEYGVSNMIEAAWLIHNVLTVEQASGYNFWSLVWPAGGLGLVQIEDPNNQSTWTNAPPGSPTEAHGYWLSPSYWAMKHFSYFVNPGFKRVGATCDDTNILISAYLSPDNLRLVAVMINTRSNASSVMNLSWGSFSAGQSAVYQTAGSNTFQLLGPVSNAQVSLPPLSLTTVVLDQVVSVGPAANPSPANGATNIPLNPALSWSRGSNAFTHAVYLGLDSAAVARATPASPEFSALSTATNYSPATLAAGKVWFWRVDEIAGGNTNVGAVWSFTTAGVPVGLAHRYTFNDGTANDSVGTANGTLQGGAFISNGSVVLNGTTAYVNLPGGLVSSLTNVTVEAWVAPAAANTWGRVFDFGSNSGGAGGQGTGQTYCFLTTVAGSGGPLRFSYTTNSAGSESPVLNGPLITNNLLYHFAVIYNHSANTSGLYVNGSLVASGSAAGPLSAISDVNDWLGKSQWADPYFKGSITEFRIYNGALTSFDIALNQTLGPDALVSPQLSVTASGGNVIVSWPTNYSGFTLSSKTNLPGGIWNSIGPAVNSGSNYQVTLPSTNTAQFFQLSK